MTYVVGDPLDEVGGVLILDVEHLLVDLLHGHASTEHGGDGEVAKITVIFLEHVKLENNQILFYPELTVRDGDHRQPSCSWRRTFAG